MKTYGIPNKEVFERKYVLKENVTAGDVVQLINEGGIAKLQKLIRDPSKGFGTELSFTPMPVDASKLFAAISLDKDRIALLHSPGGNTLRCTIATISQDGDISFGTSATITSSASFSSPSSASMCLIAPDKLLIYYNNSSSLSTLVVATVSGTTVTAVGAPIQISSTTNLYVFMCSIGDNKFALSYNASQNNAYALVGTVSGTTITVGSTVVVLAGQCYHTSIAPLGVDKFVVLYSAGDSYTGAYARVGTVSGTTITLGSDVQYSTSYVTSAKVSQIDTDKCVIAYNDGTYMRFVVGSVTGTAITLGSVVTGVRMGTVNSIASMGTNTFICAYRTAYYALYVVYGAVSGTTVSLGVPAMLSRSDSIYQLSLAVPLDQERFISIIGSWYSIGEIKLFVDYIVGTSIKYLSGAVLHISQTSSPYKITACSLGGNKFAVAIYNMITYNSLHLIIGTISGTIITFGAPVEVYNYNTSTPEKMISLGIDKLLIAYSTDNVYVVAATVTGLVPTLGTPVIALPGSATRIALIRMNDTSNGQQRFVVSSGTSSYYSMKAGLVNGTTVSFSAPAVTISGTFTTSVSHSIHQLDGDEFMLCYTGSSNIICNKYRLEVDDISISGLIPNNIQVPVGNVVLKSCTLSRNKFLILADDTSKSETYLIIGILKNDCITFSDPLRVQRAADNIPPSLAQAGENRFILTRQTDIDNTVNALTIWEGVVNNMSIQLEKKQQSSAVTSSFLHSAVVPLSFGQYILAFTDSSRYHGIISLIQSSLFTKVFGIAKKSGIAGSSVPVDQTGMINTSYKKQLTTGAVYGVDNKSRLTTSMENNKIIGVALSDSELLITNTDNSQI